MIYFYAGLGAAMLSGIMLLFEVGLALTGQSLFEEPTYSGFYQDVANSSDQLFLRMLVEPLELKILGAGRYGPVLCQQILCRIHGIGCRYGNTQTPLYASLKGYSTPRSTSATGMWSSSCALERQLDQAGFTHRLLIRPNRERPALGYELYSCVVKETSVNHRCLFERGA